MSSTVMMRTVCPCDALIQRRKPRCGAASSRSSPSIAGAGLPTRSFSGLEDVVRGSLLERGEGVLVVRRHEHDMAAAAQLPRHLETGEPGHLDVEEQHVGRMRFDFPQGRDAVAGLRDDVELRPEGAEQLGELLAQQRFVLGDDGAWSGQHVVPDAMAPAAMFACSGRRCHLPCGVHRESEGRQSALGVGQFWLAMVWCAGRSSLFATMTTRSTCCDASSRSAPPTIEAFTAIMAAAFTSTAMPRASR